MLLIECPHCGPRNEVEFINGGEAAKQRPTNPSSLNDTEWNHHIYGCSNTKGWLPEYWLHAFGCGKWIEIERNTVTHEIRAGITRSVEQ